MNEFVQAELLKEWANWREICPVCGHVCPMLLPLVEGGPVMCAWCAREKTREAQNAQHKAVTKRQSRRLETRHRTRTATQRKEQCAEQSDAATHDALFDAPYGFH